jgi:hypothetical protein
VVIYSGEKRYSWTVFSVLEKLGANCSNNVFFHLVLAETFLSEQVVVGAGNLGKNNK